MKVNFDELGEYGRWAIVGFDGRLITKILENGNHDGMLDIRLTINGVELPFDELMKRFGEACDRSVVEEVEKANIFVKSMREQANEIEKVIESLRDILKTVEMNSYHYDEE